MKVSKEYFTYLVRTVDFSFENGSKYKLPISIGDGPHSVDKKVKKMNSQKIPDAA